MHYKIFISNPADHFIGVQWQIKNDARVPLEVQLPSWRPGRYELANYAKNIRCFTAKNIKGEELLFKKKTKDCWCIYCEGEAEVIIEYEYYANQYDAGASYVSDELLYINPVNCLMYVVDRMDEHAAVALDVPENFAIACQLPHEDKTLHAKSFDELADSPFIASSTLTHHSFQVNKSTLHFWFQGAPCPQIEQLITDTKAYTGAQTNVFGELPCKDFHFLYLILKTPFRHGVEHTDSTVIAAGPETDWGNQDFYDDFVAISSHELFHLWNVKRIRPQEMLPYNFTRENYSELGYIYEGITTYYGDLMLLRSGVWSFKKFQKSFNADLKKHLENTGRFNYSIAQSSYDTWLDGYVPGVKGRKVSIYIEGMLAAMIADIMIIKASNGKARLDDVLRHLYKETYKKGVGYTKQIYHNLLEHYSGISFDAYFKEVIDGTGHIENYLKEALNLIGLTYISELEDEENKIANIIQMDLINSEQQHFFEIWCKKP